MEVYRKNSIAIEHGVAEGRLVLRCLHALDSEEFREGLLKALQYARQFHIKQWLLDLREIGKLSEEEETWVQVQLFPQIMMHLGTDNYVAVVVDEGCYESMVVESGLLGLKSYNSFIILNTFSNVEDATAWLDGERANCA
jgi:hypothetical protein